MPMARTVQRNLRPTAPQTASLSYMSAFSPKPTVRYRPKADVAGVLGLGDDGRSHGDIPMPTARCYLCKRQIEPPEQGVRLTSIGMDRSSQPSFVHSNCRDNLFSDPSPEGCLHARRVESLSGKAAVTVEQGDHGQWRYVGWTWSDADPTDPYSSPGWSVSCFSGLYADEDSAFQEANLYLDLLA